MEKVCNNQGDCMDNSDEPSEECGQSNPLCLISLPGIRCVNMSIFGLIIRSRRGGEHLNHITAWKKSELSSLFCLVGGF